MSAKTIIAALLGLFVVIYIFAGNGGTRPGEADKRRMADLRDLSGFVRCVAQLEDDILPDALRPVDLCGRTINMDDPVTNIAYGYEKLSDVSYRVCATFDKPERVVEQWYGVGTYDPATGCATLPLSAEE